MNILVTLNSAYINPLCVMLRSLSASNSGEHINLYVAHSSLDNSDFEKIRYALIDADAQIIPLRLDDTLFEDAPVLKRVSKETYYRLFAPLYLPVTVDRVLYIDPDTVVINKLREFYNTPFDDNLIIGAKHFDGLIDGWNRNRLGIRNSGKYINAGVMLMNISGMRREFSAKRIFSLIRRYHHLLFLADQDAINILYDGRIGIYTEFKINLDERTFSHMLKKMSVADALAIVRDITMIVHYNGSNKPWKDEYEGYLKCFWDEYVYRIPSEKKRGA